MNRPNWLILLNASCEACSMVCCRVSRVITSAGSESRMEPCVVVFAVLVLGVATLVVQLVWPEANSVHARVVHLLTSLLGRRA